MRSFVQTAYTDFVSSRAHVIAASVQRTRYGRQLMLGADARCCSMSFPRFLMFAAIRPTVLDAELEDKSVPRCSVPKAVSKGCTRNTCHAVLGRRAAPGSYSM
jgi:hypothetical protein